MVVSAPEKAGKAANAAVESADAAKRPAREVVDSGHALTPGLKSICLLLSSRSRRSILDMSTKNSGQYQVAVPGSTVLPATIEGAIYLGVEPFMVRYPCLRETRIPC